MLLSREVKKKLKGWCEIGGTSGNRGDVNVINVDGDIVDGGCNEEMLSDGVIGEKGVGWEVDEGGGVMNEGDKRCSLGLKLGRSWLAALRLNSCIHAMRMFF